MDMLVVGATGYLGSEVARQASAAGYEVTGTSSAELDITDRAETLAYIETLHPAVVVNCAYRDNSWAVSADGAAHVALAAAWAGARLVHLSTDALHAGRREPYLDAEPPTPVHPYGAAKAAAETAVTAIEPSAVIVRTSLIIGDDRSKHLALALDLAAGRREGALFTDEFRCPVAVQDLAAAVLDLAAGDYWGPINVAGPQAMSRAEMGRLVARRHGLDPYRIPTCTIAEAGVGPRPANVILDSSRAAALLKTRIRPASECI
jgi:dTDP-4-dehydrorhamnose reductase